MPALARVALLFALVLTAACAPQLTPSQALTWDAYKACQSEGPSTNLERVQPDGNWYVTGREGEIFKVSACMQDYWRKAARENRVPVVPAVLKVTPAPARANGLVVEAPPQWAEGDLWRFASQGPGSRRSAYNWRVQREDTVDGVPYYVLKTGLREAFYRKSDLAVSHEMVSDKVVVRNTPARVFYVWPLAQGARWDQTYRHERPEDNRGYNHVYEGRVEAEETVTVPAGTFKTLRIAYRNDSSAKIAWAQWYAPEARFWVRMREEVEGGERVTELQSFELRKR
jgi:hypothetical protein